MRKYKSGRLSAWVSLLFYSQAKNSFNPSNVWLYSTLERAFSGPWILIDHWKIHTFFMFHEKIIFFMVIHFSCGRLHVSYLSLNYKTAAITHRLEWRKQFWLHIFKLKRQSVKNSSIPLPAHLVWQSTTSWFEVAKLATTIDLTEWFFVTTPSFKNEHVSKHNSGLGYKVTVRQRSVTGFCSRLNLPAQ